MDNMQFKLEAKFKPAGDQPKAIKKLVEGLRSGAKHQTLLGVTGSGKTFTVANIIESLQKPTLVIAPNKTLAAQLTSEFRRFFPKNAVCYFVSYYDYYQPEAYLPTTDIYIEKEAEINEEIDKLRHAATASLLTRSDVIICASVSCIYGLGSPEFYREITMFLSKGQIIGRRDLLRNLAKMHYRRSEVLKPGRFRVRGETIEIMPPGKENFWQVELVEDRVKNIFEFDGLTRKRLSTLREVAIWPAKHFVVPEPLAEVAIEEIKKELKDRTSYFKKRGLFLEAERLERRTRFDLEMMAELGYCAGIENYSRYLTGRLPGQPPYTLIDYFPKDFLLVIDESHLTIPQIGGMYEGDRSRKETLIRYGFRLPSALDNRPLKFHEFEKKENQVIYTSATPGPYEAKISAQIVEQVIRPTGLIDPEVIVRPGEDQVEDLTEEIEKCIKNKERVLVTTLTKKMAEDLSAYLSEKGFASEYLHSEVQTLERVRILEDLRRGRFDILVGVNLLREGLDLPEVTLVAILDADREGFLRSETSLIQTMGRAARNVRGRVILYADEETPSMKKALKETNRRRKLQAEYNAAHHITPRTIKKKIASIIDYELKPEELAPEYTHLERLEDIPKIIKLKESQMHELAKNLQFEKAALVRDEIRQLEKLRLK